MHLPPVGSPTYSILYSYSVLYYEDLEIGRIYGSDTILVSEEEVIAFGRAYDPQPFHTDAVAAKESVFGQLVASGWHTAALTMRLRVTGELQLAGSHSTSIGEGSSMERLSWEAAVGFTLSCRGSASAECYPSGPQLPGMERCCSVQNSP